MFNIKQLDLYLIFMVTFFLCVYMIKMTSNNIEAFYEYNQRKYIHNHHHNSFHNSKKVEGFACDKHKNLCLSRKHHDDDFTDTAKFANLGKENFDCGCDNNKLASFINVEENFTNSCKALIC